MRQLPFLTVLFVALALVAAPARAQQAATPAPTATVQLDGAKAALDQVEAALARTDLSDKTLRTLRAQVDPVGLDL